MNLLDYSHKNAHKREATPEPYFRARGTLGFPEVFGKTRFDSSPKRSK